MSARENCVMDHMEEKMLCQKLEQELKTLKFHQSMHFTKSEDLETSMNTMRSLLQTAAKNSDFKIKYEKIIFLAFLELCTVLEMLRVKRM